MTFSLILTRAEVSSPASRASIRCSLSGLTWAVALLYDPMASSFSWHGTIQRRLSPLVPQGPTIGAWFTPRGLQAVGAFPALLVSHRCETSNAGKAPTACSPRGVNHAPIVGPCGTNGLNLLWIVPCQENELAIGS